MKRIFQRDDGCSGGNYRCDSCGQAWTDHIAPGCQCPDQTPPRPWYAAGDCGDSGYRAIYDSRGNKLALVFDADAEALILNYQRALEEAEVESARLELALRELLPVAKETCKRWPNDECFTAPTAEAQATLDALSIRRSRKNGN